jgi:hypothetical protein
MFNRDWNNSFFLFSFFSFLQNIAVNNFKQYKESGKTIKKILINNNNKKDE